MKKYRNFLSENFPILFVKFSIYLKRRVFVMLLGTGYTVLFVHFNIYEAISLYRSFPGLHRMHFLLPLND